MANEKNEKPNITVLNYTNFFHKELFMYSLGDIRFKKPISLKKVGYTTLFLVVWTLPLFFLMGPPGGPISAFFIIGIPFIAGHFASKPVFGGKTLVDFVKTTINYIGEPKGWTDGEPIKGTPSEKLYVENQIWISRRREIEALANNKLDELK